MLWIEARMDVERVSAWEGADALKRPAVAGLWAGGAPPCRPAVSVLESGIINEIWNPNPLQLDHGDIVTAADSAAVAQNRPQDAPSGIGLRAIAGGRLLAPFAIVREKSVQIGLQPRPSQAVEGRSRGDPNPFAGVGSNMEHPGRSGLG